VFAVIRAGGRQYKISKGDVIEVERISPSSEAVEFAPILVVDDKGKLRAKSSELSGAVVTAKVLGESKAAKVQVLKYRPKTGYRRRRGHRQPHTKLEISDIKLRKGRSKSSSSSKTTKGNEDGT
jgi:large subunit ribosomal protein L21